MAATLIGGPVFASLRAPVPPVLALVDLVDASEEAEELDRQKILLSDNRDTTAPPFETGDDRVAPDRHLVTGIKKYQRPIARPLTDQGLGSI